MKKIIPKGYFFDYESKYSMDGASEERAQLPNDLDNKILELSKRCWEIFDCKGYARIDIIVVKMRFMYLS